MKLGARRSELGDGSSELGATSMGDSYKHIERRVDRAVPCSMLFYAVEDRHIFGIARGAADPPLEIFYE